MKDYPETHQQGYISMENQFVFPIRGDLGIQIAKDGRVWVCINGIAFIRFSPDRQARVRKATGLVRREPVHSRQQRRLGEPG